MLVSLRDCRYSKKDQQWIESVYGEYLDALADLNTGFFPVMGGDNARKEEIFASWFASDRSHPLLILQELVPVGFALVSRSNIPGATPAVDFRMAEFFVRKSHRQSGIGREAATLIFDRFAGEWEILEYLRNPGAVAFWRKVITGYCGNNFTERTQSGEVRQRFKSRKAK